MEPEVTYLIFMDAYNNAFLQFKSEKIIKRYYNYMLTTN